RFSRDWSSDVCSSDLVSGQQGHASQKETSKRPVILCANNGLAYVEAAYAALKGGADTLDAAIQVVKGPENDPNDDSVGFGGLPKIGRASCRERGESRG